MIVNIFYSSRGMGVGNVLPATVTSKVTQGHTILSLISIIFTNICQNWRTSQSHRQSYTLCKYSNVSEMVRKEMLLPQVYRYTTDAGDDTWPIK